MFKKSLALAFRHQSKIGITHTSDGIRITEENYDYLYHYWKEHSGEYDPKGNVAVANHISLKYKTENELKFEKWAMWEFGMTNEEQTEHTLPGLLSSVLEISNVVDVILLPVSLFSAGAKFVEKEALKEGGEELAETAGKNLAQMVGKEVLQEAATKELEKEALKALFKKAAIENLEKSAKSLAKETKEKLIKVTEGFVEKYFDKWLSWNRSLAVAAEGGGRVQAQYMMRDTAKNAVKKEVAGEAMEKTGKEAVEETTEKLAKDAVDDATRTITKVEDRREAKSINDIIAGTKETTNNVGIARNFEKTGGYKETLEDFNALQPFNVKDVKTQYGLGKIGFLEDGTRAVARPESKTGGAALEIKVSNSKVYNIRHQ